MSKVYLKNASMVIFIKATAEQEETYTKAIQSDPELEGCIITKCSDPVNAKEVILQARNPQPSQAVSEQNETNMASHNQRFFATTSQLTPDQMRRREKGPLLNNVTNDNIHKL